MRLGLVGRGHETFEQGGGKVESFFSSNPRQRSRVYHGQLQHPTSKGRLKKGGQTAMGGGEPCTKPTSPPFTSIIYYNQLR
jgi:hypothetical protein